MIDIINYEDPYKPSIYNRTDDIYLDIETTGLKRNSDYAWVIGAAFVKEDKIESKQIFIKSKDDEKESLLYLNELLKNKQRIVTFNGNIFDIPFLNERAAAYGITLNFPQEQYDLYELIRKHNKFLMIKRINLKTAEKFMRIERNDPLAGKETLTLYKTYVETGYEYLKKSLLNHNYCDIKNLPPLMNVNAVIKNYNTLYDTRFVINDFYTIGNSIITELICRRPIPEVSIFDGDISIEGNMNFLQIKFTLQKAMKDGMELLYFGDTKKVVKWERIYYTILRERIEETIKKYGI